MYLAYSIWIRDTFLLYIQSWWVLMQLSLICSTISQLAYGSSLLTGILVNSFFLELAVFLKQKPHPLGKYSHIKQINKLSSLGFNKLEKKVGAVGHERRGTSFSHTFWKLSSIELFINYWFQFLRKQDSGRKMSGHISESF